MTLLAYFCVLEEKENIPVYLLLGVMQLMNQHLGCGVFKPVAVEIEELNHVEFEQKDSKNIC